MMYSYATSVSQDLPRGQVNVQISKSNRSVVANMLMDYISTQKALCRVKQDVTLLQTRKFLPSLSLTFFSPLWQWSWDCVVCESPPNWSSHKPSRVNTQTFFADQCEANINPHVVGWTFAGTISHDTPLLRGNWSRNANFVFICFSARLRSKMRNYSANRQNTERKRDPQLRLKKARVWKPHTCRCKYMNSIISSKDEPCNVQWSSRVQDGRNRFSVAQHLR